MNKSKMIFALVVAVILGSLAAFFGTNLILSDVSNMFYMTITKDVLSSVPMFIVILEFIFAILCIARCIEHPECKKRIVTLYTRIGFITSIIGMASTIAAYEIVYGEIKAPYPFKYAGVVLVLWHLGVWKISDSYMWQAKKWEEYTKRQRISFGYVLYNVVLGLFIFYALNRFGAFLMVPTFVQMSTLDKTLPLYICLLLLMALLANAFQVRLGMNAKKAKRSLIYSLVVLLVGILGVVYVMFIGMKDTRYISAVSPVMPIERLLTKPIDSVLLFSV
ncbi:MAG: hypothetical protein Q4E99_00945, partial [Bacillota bacterium]|nr:hypothetical protein [Bacillota bacterium]